VRISTKITLAFTGTGILLFGGYGVYLMRNERAALFDSVEREMRLIGRSVEISAENALRDRQLADIDEVISTLARDENKFAMLVYDSGGRAILASRAPLVGDDVADAAAHGAIASTHTVLQFDPPDEPRRLVLALALLDDDGSVSGAVTISRDLDDLWADLRNTRAGIALSVSLFVLASAVVGMIFGAVYIGRPLARMTAAMQLVRGGNLHSALSIDRRDEMGDLARVFNDMVIDLQQARQQLEQEGESRRRLQQSLQEADKLITIGQLSAGLAHEIGTPLQILNGRARALLSRAHDPLETKRYGQILVAQSDRIARIVEQLLRFARRRRSQLSAIDLTATVSEVVDLLQYEARRRGVVLSVTCPHELPRISIEGDQLQQVVLNLVTNAMHATGNGGMIGIELVSATLATASGRRMPGVRLVVRDTGTGIAPEHRDHLFEPFFTTRPGEGGTGLGLAVVRAIVTDHGGTIDVHSEPLRGSTFTVEFPVSHRPLAAAWEA